MQKWSCDIIPPSQLPEDVADFCERIDAQVIRMPIRKRGVTSSGKVGQCYLNVNIATKLFGGSAVAGWVLVRSTDTALKGQMKYTAVLLGHAVWLNVQNRASCVTGKSWGANNGVYEKDGKSYFDFVIWDENPKSSPVFLKDLFFKNNWCAQETEIEWAEDGMRESTALELLTRKKARSLLVSWFNNAFWESIEDRILTTYGIARGTRKLVKDSEALGGGFTEKSVATGKTYEEIRDERLKRLTSSGKKTD